MLDKEDVPQTEHAGATEETPLTPARCSEIMRNYEKKCLSHIKKLCEQLSDKKAALQENYKETEKLKDDNEELAARCKHLEDKAYDEFVETNDEIKALFDHIKKTNDSQIFKSMVEKIVKQEHEIQRHSIVRRKMLNECIDAEAVANERTNMLYSIVSSYISHR